MSDIADLTRRVEALENQLRALERRLTPAQEVSPALLRTEDQTEAALAEAKTAHRSAERLHSALLETEREVARGRQLVAEQDSNSERSK